MDVWCRVMQLLVGCGNCPEWYHVTEYVFQNQTRSDCINAFVYGFNDSTIIQRNRRVYYSMFFVVGYAVPLTVICIFYVLLLRRIGGHGRVSGQPGDAGSTSLKAAATRRRVMRMVTAVIVTFAACWLPTHVAFLVEAFTSIGEYYRVEMVAFQIVATCLAYVNSCLNPVIYAFLSENFRQSFRELVFVGGRRRSDRSLVSLARNRPRNGNEKNRTDTDTISWRQDLISLKVKAKGQYPADPSPEGFMASRRNRQRGEATPV